MLKLKTFRHFIKGNCIRRPSFYSGSQILLYYKSKSLCQQRNVVLWSKNYRFTGRCSYKNRLGSKKRKFTGNSIYMRESHIDMRISRYLSEPLNGNTCNQFFRHHWVSINLDIPAGQEKVLNFMRVLESIIVMVTKKVIILDAWYNFQK